MRESVWLRRLLCAAMLVSVLALSACGGKGKEDGLFAGMTVGKASVYDILDVSKLTPDKEAKPLWETTDKARIRELMAPFEGWRMKDHYGEALDGVGMVYVFFDDRVAIEYIGKLDAAGYGYCGRIFVDGVFRGICDLPADFGLAVEKLLGQ